MHSLACLAIVLVSALSLAFAIPAPQALNPRNLDTTVTTVAMSMSRAMTTMTMTRTATVTVAATSDEYGIDEAAGMAERALLGDDHNDVVKRICRPVTVIFARGTMEMGNTGRLVGPPFFKALSKQLGGGQIVAIQGVNYKATLDQYFKGGDHRGALDMAKRVLEAIIACPNTQVVLSGYRYARPECFTSRCYSPRV